MNKPEGEIVSTSSKRRPLLGLALIACLPISAGWLGFEVYLTGPRIVGWQLWLLASAVLLIAVAAMMALADGQNSEETDL